MNVTGTQVLLECAADIAATQALVADDEEPKPFFPFCRQMYAAAGCPVPENEVTKIRIGF